MMSTALGSTKEKSKGIYSFGTLVLKVSTPRSPVNYILMRDQSLPRAKDSRHHTLC